MSRTIDVKLRERSYSVVVERFGLQHPETWFAADKPSSLFLFCDSTLTDSVGAPLLERLKSAGFAAHMQQVEAGESGKTLATVEKIYSDLVRHNVDRRSCVLALGGGVVGDIAGYVAATVLRGISWIQLPTTLLAQVDASIGGKVGVNFQGLKNMIGAFYQPRKVIVDAEVLSSLPHRQFMNGMAEVVKYALIDDKKLFAYLQSKSAWNATDLAFCDEILERSIRCKAKIVGRDEHEHGVRAYLNFGHTVGHAVELASPNLLHGEAVVLGMVFAIKLSQAKKLCTDRDAQHALSLLQKFATKDTVKDLEFDDIWRKLWHDKKRVGHSVNMILFKKIGRVEVIPVAQEEVKAVFCNSNPWWRI